MSEYDFGPQPRSDKNRDAYVPPVPSQSRAPSSQREMGQMEFEDFNSDFASFDPFDPYGDELWEELELMTHEELEKLKSDPEAVAQRVAELDLENAKDSRAEAGASLEEVRAMQEVSMQEIQGRVQEADRQVGMKSAIVYLTFRQGEDFAGIEIMMVPGNP